MICPHCGNELHNVIELNQPINQPLHFNLGAAASLSSGIYTTETFINPVNVNSAAPVSGTFTIITNPKN